MEYIEYESAISFDALLPARHNFFNNTDISLDKQYLIAEEMQAILCG